MDSNPNYQKSKGHVAFYEYGGSWYELFKDARGELFRANVTDAMDVHGYRQGRWEAPAHMADKAADMILQYNAQSV